MNTPSSRGYIPEIDSLRAIAVLSVILFHFNPLLLPGGFAGVDVFFVISGYVVSSSLAKHNQAYFLSFTLQFYARRIIRIYPALLACLVIVGLIQTLLVPASWLSNSSNNTALYAFAGLSNFALIWFNDGYFSPRVEFNAFTHTWSLAVEEQFYLLFPFIFFIWIKFNQKSNIIGFLSRYLLPLLLLSSLIYAAYETKTSPEHAYYLLPSRFWELASGAILFILHQKNTCLAQQKHTSNIALFLGFALIALGFVYSEPKSFPFPWALLASSGTILLISGVANASNQGLLKKALQPLPLVYIGKISYSLYLWHWPILAMFRWTVGLDQPIYLITAALLTTLISVFSYHFIEKPIRKHPLLHSKPNWQIVGAGVSFIILSFICTQFIFKAQPLLSLSVTKDAQNWYPEPWGSANNYPPIARHFTKRKIFVMGDSHTGAYRTMLRMLSDQQGVEVFSYSAAGCAIANLRYTANPDCKRFISESLAEIEKNSAPGDVVFLASLRMPRLSDQWVTFQDDQVIDSNKTADSPEMREQVVKEAEEIITRLEQASLIVMLDAPKPIFKSPAFRCADWFNAQNPVCRGGLSISRHFLQTMSQPVIRTISTLQTKHPKLVVWDTIPILCNTENCSAFDGKQPLFFDGDHLSAHGNRVLYPSFLSILTAIWKANQG
ncbi:acyltransferase family protein [Iodobacter sp.]|uniref:acyltransferase family protein n=1 Tax=Iodobacter sp. TaxID=1915058 RepID=UPI0025CD5F93|nr:acyltransferase family protein [Iodobacter sp.]